jgi:hypothetical protein
VPWEELVGKTVEAVADAPGMDGRVPFRVVWDGQVLGDVRAFVELPKDERDSFARKTPKGTRIRARILRYQQGTVMLSRPLT